MDVRSDIRAWLIKQPDWLQETAHRLLINDGFEASDVSEVVALLKTPAGQKPSSHRTFDGLKPTAGALDELRLVSISGICGIENLAPKNPLEFGKENLTVIYGHNGSGKSSYTRVLKKIAGKPRAVDLKTNVFQTSPLESKCHITSSLNGLENVSQWHVGDDPIDSLRGLDVFDSDEAKHYLTAESPATYMPPVLGLFEKLARSVEQVKESLTAEQAALISALPAIPVTYQVTVAGQQYGALAKLTPSALSQALNWTADDQKSLTDLTERLNVADPGALAKQKRSTKAQLDQVVAGLTRAAASYSLSNIQALRDLRTDAQGNRKIAAEAGQVKSAVLEGVGTPTWRAMWEAARQFSATPYANDDFPVTTQARCLLCHQDLTPEAQKRLNDFEGFVQSTLEKTAKTAETLYQAAIAQLPSPPLEQQLDTQCEAAGLGEDWKKNLKAFWQRVAVAQTALINDELIHSAEPVGDISNAVNKLNVYREQLETKAAQFEEDALLFDRVQAAKDKLGYEAKEWVVQQAAAVGIEVDRLLKVKSFDTWKGLAGSRSISMKAAEITQTVVTEAYVARFNKELSALGASRIQVELVKTRTRNAKVLHQLRLKGAQTGRDLPDSILSEGERRIISLAAFLADVCEKPGAAPFVFDDPISSLDHDFEWNVACRLVELAKTRQVIVLTHRLSLYGTLEDVARKAGDTWKKAHHRPMCIEAYAGVAGHPADQAVWNANTKTANNLLLTRLVDAKKAGDSNGASAYQGLAQGICSEFRKLLERSVEEDLLNKVVVRHRRSVTTDNRLNAVSDVGVADCSFIDTLMTKYSCYEHSQSAEVPVVIPDEPELRADLESLKKWRDDMVVRRAPKAAC